jgi:hypothetical protein
MWQERCLSVCLSLSVSLSDDASLVFTESKGTDECLPTGSPLFTAGLCCRSVNESLQLRQGSAFGSDGQQFCAQCNSTRKHLLKHGILTNCAVCGGGKLQWYLQSSRFAADGVAQWNCGGLGH